jgi:hypothetical protein
VHRPSSTYGTSLFWTKSTVELGKVPLTKSEKWRLVPESVVRRLSQEFAHIGNPHAEIAML